MVEGLIFGFIIWLSTLFTFHHSPKWFKNFCLKHPFLTDVLDSIFVYFTVSSVSHSIVAIVSAVVSGMLVNTSLLIYQFFNGKEKPVSTKEKN